MFNEGMSCLSRPTPVRVTFDSNVWQKVVFPDKVPLDPSHRSLTHINEALQKGSARGLSVRNSGDA